MTAIACASRVDAGARRSGPFEAICKYSIHDQARRRNGIGQIGHADIARGVGEIRRLLTAVRVHLARCVRDAHGDSARRGSGRHLKIENGYCCPATIGSGSRSSVDTGSSDRWRWCDAQPGRQRVHDSEITARDGAFAVGNRESQLCRAARTNYIRSKRFLKSDAHCLRRNGAQDCAQQARQHNTDADRVRSRASCNHVWNPQKPGSESLREKCTPQRAGSGSSSTEPSLDRARMTSVQSGVLGAIALRVDACARGARQVLLRKPRPKSRVVRAGFEALAPKKEPAEVAG